MRTLLSMPWDVSTRALLAVADCCKGFSALSVLRRLLLEPTQPRIWLLSLLMETGLWCFSLAKRRKEVVASSASLLTVSVGRISTVVVEARGLIQVAQPPDALHELSQALGIAWMQTIPRLKQSVPLVGTKAQSIHQLVGFSSSVDVQATPLLCSVEHYIESSQSRIDGLMSWCREVLEVNHG